MGVRVSMWREHVEKTSSSGQRGVVKRVDSCIMKHP